MRPTSDVAHSNYLRSCCSGARARRSIRTRRAQFAPRLAPRPAASPQLVLHGHLMTPSEPAKCMPGGTCNGLSPGRNTARSPREHSSSPSPVRPAESSPETAAARQGVARVSRPECVRLRRCRRRARRQQRRCRPPIPGPPAKTYVRYVNVAACLGGANSRHADLNADGGLLQRCQPDHSRCPALDR